jgi:hypothetical protein
MIGRDHAEFRSEYAPAVPVASEPAKNAATIPSSAEQASMNLVT